MCQPQNLRGWYITCPQSPQPVLGSPFYQCLEHNWPLLRVRKRVSRRVLQPHHPWGNTPWDSAGSKAQLSAALTISGFSSHLLFPFTCPASLVHPNSPVSRAVKSKGWAKLCSDEELAQGRGNRKDESPGKLGHDWLPDAVSEQESLNGWTWWS